jgi:cytochrome c
MNRRRARIAAMAVAAAAAIAWGGDWFARQLIPVIYPGELAYKPDEVPPPVDLAAVQRGWPGGLDAPGERNRLAAYMHDIERQAPMPAQPKAAPVPAKPVDLAALLASADPDAGKAKARACLTCHDFQQGGPDRIGPNLWGVMGRDVASRPGFAYSPAMTSQAGAWTYDRMFAFLASPARDMPGTKMSYAGLSRPEDRAAILKYLATLGGHAPPPQTQGAGRSGTAK